MGVAFELEVTRSRNAALWGLALSAVPVAGLVLAGARLLSGPTVLSDGPGPGASLAGLACLGLAGAAALVAVRRVDRRHPPASVQLRVDDVGAASLRFDGAPAVPFTLASTCALPGLTLLVMSPYRTRPSRQQRGRSVTLAIGRDCARADDWRRLQVWLRWLERGRSDRPEAESDQT